MKKDIFGDDTTKNLGFKILEKTPKHAHLQVLLAQWQNIIDSAEFDNEIIMTNNRAKHWYILSIKANTQIKNIISILQRTRHEEWIKPIIYIGKYGSVANMVHPKICSGQVAGSFYPTKPGELVHRAINDAQCKEASILTHQMWMSDPSGL